jgi:hypothetical protein
LPFSVDVSSPSVFVPAMEGAVHVVVPPLLDPPLDEPPLDDPPLEDPPLDDPPLDDPPLDEPPELDVVSSSPPVSSLGSVPNGDFVGWEAGVVDSTVQATRIEVAAATVASERSRRMKHSLVMKEQPASDEARPRRIHGFLL